VCARGDSHCRCGRVIAGGNPLGAPHHFNSTTLTLQWTGLPALSAAAAAAIDSDVLTSADNISLRITFKKAPRQSTSPTTAPAAAAVDCSAWHCTCAGLGVTYGTVAGAGFGCAPPAARAW
jgi:hypothetical protein